MSIVVVKQYAAMAVVPSMLTADKYSYGIFLLLARFARDVVRFIPDVVPVYGFGLLLLLIVTILIFPNMSEEDDGG